MKNIRNPWTSFGLSGYYRLPTISDKDKPYQTEGAGNSQNESKGIDNRILIKATKTEKEEREIADNKEVRNHAYWPSRMRSRLKMLRSLRMLKRGSQNNWDRITKRRNHDNVKDDDNNSYKEELENIMLKENNEDNIAQEKECNGPFLSHDNYTSLQVYNDENPLQQEDDFYTEFQAEDEDQTAAEEQAGNTVQEREEGNQYFQKGKNYFFQDDVEAKYIQEMNEVNTPIYNLCTSFKCWGPRMLKVWGKKDGGRATSGSWNPAGKRNGETWGSWGPSGITLGKGCK